MGAVPYLHCLLKPALEPGTVLYEAEVMQFAEDLKKWKERYIVIKDDFAMESYESREVRRVLVTTGPGSTLACPVWSGDGHGGLACRVLGTQQAIEWADDHKWA